MHDRPGNDHRYAPNGALAGRRRRAERTDRTGSHRWPSVRNGGYAVYRAGDVLADEQGGSGELGKAVRGRDPGSVGRNAPMSADVSTSMPAGGDPQHRAKPEP